MDTDTEAGVARESDDETEFAPEYGSVPLAPTRVVKTRFRYVGRLPAMPYPDED